MTSDSKQISVSEINITPIKPHNGLVAFASFVLNGSLYCSSVGVVTRLNGGYRLVYPTKEVAGRQLQIFHPISGELGCLLEKVVTAKYEEVMNNGRSRHSDFIVTD